MIRGKGFCAVCGAEYSYTVLTGGCFVKIAHVNCVCGVVVE